MIKFEEINYKTFGRCILMTNGIVELVATLDIGPRIIRYAQVGGENFMMEDESFSHNQDDKKDIFVDKFGEETKMTFHNLGGSRLWTSPEAYPRTYYPDMEPVSYTAEGNKLTLIPPQQRWTQQQHQIEVVMADDKALVDVYYKITNIGAWPQKFSPWSLTVLALGGTEVIPMNDRPTGLLSNRKITLWPYSKMNDPRVTWGDKYIFLATDENNDNAFKLGIDSQYNWSAYFLNNSVFLKKFDIIDDAEYPDGGMIFETYVCGSFIEMETLGEYKVIEPESTHYHHESWEIISDIAYPGNNEEEITSSLADYIK